VCDLQTRFRPLIWKAESVIARSKLLIDTCKLLKIPILVTEQNPARFGPTLPELDPGSAQVLSKMRFSMRTPEVHEAWTKLNTEQVIVVGIEAHVCVQQTVLDFLADPIRRPRVFIVKDATSSQRRYDRDVALERMVGMGAVPVTAESAVFELLRSADHPQFKEASALVKMTNQLDQDPFV